MSGNRFYGIVCALAAVSAAMAQQTPPQTVIRTETRVVLVDVVVTDKKDNYVHDLDQKDFKVWEDDKQQNISSFSFEADPNGPAHDQKRYMLMLFDNSSMQLADQTRARDAAKQFVDKNAGPNHYMAVANFSGSLQMVQNFTTDADRLRNALNGIKMAVGPGGSFGVRTSILALRSLARGMSDVPGRKILVFFSGGMRLNMETQSELTAAIAECNHSNVAVYPVDVRGLFTNQPGLDRPTTPGRGRGGPGGGGMAMLPIFGGLPLATAFFDPQRGGTSGGGGATSGGAGGGATGTGGGAGGRGAGGGTGATGGTGGGTGTVGRGGAPGGTFGGPGTGRAGTGSGNTGTTGRGGFGGGGTPFPNNGRERGMNNNRGIIVPPAPPFASAEQSALYMLADSTGGKVMLNSNDLLGSLEKIGKEQNEYYLLGYTPPESPEGSCHNLKVKVNKGGMMVRARTGYCNVHKTDPLEGKPVEKTLETEMLGSEPGKLRAPMQLPYFFTGANTARVQVAMEIPTESVKFDKVKGKQHAEINLLGVAYKRDGSVAARFSDTVKLDFNDKKEVEEFASKPMHYDNQFDIASGKYNFKLAFQAGPEWGKLEKPLDVEEFDGKKVAISSIALSKEIHKVSDTEASLDAVLLEGRTPLIASGIEVVPSGVTKFKKTDTAITYMEVYEPENVEKEPPKLGVQLTVTDKKTGTVQGDSGMIEMTKLEQQGSPVVPIGLKLPVAQLAPGTYVAEYTVKDSLGRSATRKIEFDVE